MKLPVILLAAITTAVVASCKKGSDTSPNPGAPTVDTATHNNNPSPDYCPGCGMG